MSKLRFFKIASYYPAFLKKFYDAKPYLKEADYITQYQAIMELGFGWSDYWKLNLNKTDKFEAEMIIVNAEYLQKQWAKENNIKFTSDNWMQDIALAQLKEHKPTVLFTNDYIYINTAFRKLAKKEVPSIQLIMGWDGYGSNDAERYRGCDLMLSCAASISKYYSSKGYNTYTFHFGFEKTILNRINAQKDIKDVSFVGSVTIGSNMYKTRLRILGELIKTIPANYYISSLTEDKAYFIKCLLKKLKNAEWQDLSDIFRLINNNKGQAFGLEMFKILAEHKININTHGDIVKNEAANIRLFEATGVGTCLVTDWKENLSEFFEPDQEVVTYKSVPEAIEKIKYLLYHEEERKKIAAAGQKRTLENYSYEKRIKDFSDFLLTQLT